MERMSDEQLDQRIHSFMKRKINQFPELHDGPLEPRRNTQSLILRVRDMTDYFPHLHKPRHAHQ